VIASRGTDPATATAEDVARAIARKLLLGDDLREACVSSVRQVLEARDERIAVLEAELRMYTGPRP